MSQWGKASSLFTHPLPSFLWSKTAKIKDRIELHVMFKTWQTQQNAFIFRNPNLQNTPFPCWTFTNTRSLSQTLRYTQIPTCCSVNSPSGRHCCWFDLENTFTPTPWSRTVAFGIEVLFWTHINHRKGRKHHTWGHHMSQCTRQTPPTLLYSNEQLWMPFSYSDGIDTDVGFADNTNASTGHISQPFI